MPKTTYGLQIQKRVKRLLAALLCFAAGEVEEDNFNIEYHWKEEDSANPKLTIRDFQRINYSKKNKRQVSQE